MIINGNDLLILSRSGNHLAKDATGHIGLRSLTEAGETGMFPFNMS